MTKQEAASFPWEIAGPLFAFVLFVAVMLTGLSILREITR